MKLPASSPMEEEAIAAAEPPNTAAPVSSGRDRRPHGEPGQVDHAEHDPHLGAGGHVPEDRAHQRGDDKGAVEHQPTRRRPVEVAQPPEKDRQGGTAKPPLLPFRVERRSSSNGVP